MALHVRIQQRRAKRHLISLSLHNNKNSTLQHCSTISPWTTMDWVMLCRMNCDLDKIVHKYCPHQATTSSTFGNRHRHFEISRTNLVMRTMAPSGYLLWELWVIVLFHHRGCRERLSSLEIEELNQVCYRTECANRHLDHWTPPTTFCFLTDITKFPSRQ